ncbi:MAG: hypothetical protein L6406_14770 [Desulfobacterales bacterium]|nr:hypothetical protein [Desulfobacterales bacterium]
MSNELSEKIKEAEGQLGRPLSAVERLNISRSMPKVDDAIERMEIILTETLEGIEALNTFHEKVEKAKVSSGVGERHKAAHEFEAVKRDLLTRFNKGEIERIGKQAA